MAMKTIELMGHVDEQHRLSGSVPAEVAPGPVRVQLVIESQAETNGEDGLDPNWEQAIAADWAQDWLDPREDLYTLADGEPVDPAGVGHDAR